VVVVPDATGVSVSPARWLANTRLLWPALVAEVGLDEPGTVAAVAQGAVLAVLAAGVVAAAWLTRHGWRTRDLPLTFLGLHAPVVVAGVLADRTVYDFHAGRYLVLAVVDVAACLAVAIALVRPRRPRLAAVGSALVATALALNVAGAALDPLAVPPLRDRQERTLAVVRATGATKGFSDFWGSDLLTQQSGGAVLMADVVCAGGRLRLRHWITDSARETAPARRTVVLWDPDAAYGRGCPLDALDRQLGPPSARVPAPTGGWVLVFDTDVATRIDPAPGQDAP